jgi:predicted dehydrogenase
MAVKLGIIGVGGMGSSHCKKLADVEELELAAVADVNAGRAQSVGEEYGVPHFGSGSELIASGLVEAVLIATPHYFHPTFAVEAFEAGLHVLSEKPIGVEIGAAERMAEAARKSGKVFGVMFQMRSLPSIRKARELVDAGELGEVRRTLFVAPEFRSQAYYDSGTWRATWAGEGGGVLLNQGPHLMDIFCLLGGLPAKVTGRCAQLMHQIEVEDHAEAVLEYANGAGGYFYASTCEVGQRLIEIVGDCGKLRVAGHGLEFWRYKPPVSEFNRTNTEMWGSPKAEKVELELAECETGHGAGLLSLELANAIILSSQKGEPVDLPLDRAEYDRLMEGLRATSSFHGEWDESEAESDPNLKKR